MFVLRHRRLVVLAWAVVLLAGAVAAGRVADRLTFDFSLPGQPGYETEVEVAELLRHQHLRHLRPGR